MTTAIDRELASAQLDHPDWVFIGWREHSPTWFSFYAYKRGALDPEPTAEDWEQRSGAIWSFLMGQRNLRPDILAADGYTVVMALWNVQRFIRHVEEEKDA